MRVKSAVVGSLEGGMVGAGRTGSSGHAAGGVENVCYVMPSG